MRYAAVALSIALSALPAAAIAPYRVADIDPVPTSLGSFPLGFATLGDRAIFYTENSGEVWSSDGTAGGTIRLARGYRVAVIANSGTVIYFTSSEFPEEGDPLRLWVTDGTAGGTFPLLDDRPVPGFGFAFFAVPGTRRLYFGFDDGVHGRELWTSDGSVSGTHLVRDLMPGNAYGFQGFSSQIAVVRDEIYFSGEDAMGPGLFTTDGTAVGTRRILRFDAPEDAAIRGPVGMISFSDRFLFYAGTAASGVEAWISDGTKAGTVKLAEVVSGAAPIAQLSGFHVAGPFAYFVAGGEGEGAELWRTNGKPAGTFRLTNFPDLRPFRRPPYSLIIGTVQGKIAFAAYDGVHGFEPWTTDGTRAGTRMIKDVCPGTCDGVAGPFFALGPRLLFAGNDHPYGGNVELWSSNLNAQGTHQVRDLCPGNCSSRPTGFAVVGNLAYLTAFDSAQRRQLWRTNGRRQGTVRLTDVTETLGLFQFGSFDVARAGSVLLFSSPDDRYRWEPWRTDGTRAGTRLLIDLPDPDFGGSSPQRFMTAGGKSFFFADDGTHGFELWSSDGTAAGTRLVRELIDGPEPTAAPLVRASAEAGGRLVFVRAGASFGGNQELWGSDGTAAGTERLLDERVIPREVLFTQGPRILFLARDEDHGEELWVTDGTKSGTRLLADTVPGPDSSGAKAFPFHSLGGRLLFRSEADSFLSTFWISDGTPEGTLPLEDAYPFLVEPLAELSTQLVEMGGKIYFDRGGSFGDSRLWVTDLTAAGTREIGAVNDEPGWRTFSLYAAGSKIYAYGLSDRGLSFWATDGRPGGAQPLGVRLNSFLDVAQPTAFGGRLFFRRLDTSELWVTNGTAAGTRAVRDPSGAPIFDPRALGVFNNQLICSTPTDIWRTNGYVAGTARLLRRRFVLDPQDWVVVGNRLYFSNLDDEAGTELWAMRP